VIVSNLDYIVFFITIFSIVFYGIWLNKKQKTIDSYLRGDRKSSWWVVFLSVAATQASAITFLSTPGQGYSDGLGFVQFYFGMPFAVVVVAYFIAPKFIGANIYTAYEYLEKRFDLKTRQITAFYFLIQRGMAAGLTIYAPAIVFSIALDISLDWIIFFLGGFVTLYTLIGGTKAVSQTQSFQMLVIFIGMIFTFVFVLFSLPQQVSLFDVVDIASISSKTEMLNFNFDLNSRYTVWSGLLGGFFLSLSYFGTDQSQVQRYLSAKSLKDSRYGLMANAILKIPMQLFILFLGVLIFVFFQFNKPPLFFNSVELGRLSESSLKKQVSILEHDADKIHRERKTMLLSYVQGDKDEVAVRGAIESLNGEERSIRDEVRSLIKENNPAAETNDKDFIFISFILKYLPAGLIGLLLAAFASASMSSTASEINSLASTTIVDFYKRSFRSNKTEGHYVIAAKIMTLLWGIWAMIFASFASLFENLIQAVNIIGSLFYGAILGVFLLAFSKWKINASAVFVAMLLSEIIVISLYFTQPIGFLWFNLIGTILVVVLSLVLTLVSKFVLKLS